VTRKDEAASWEKEAPLRSGLSFACKLSADSCALHHAASVVKALDDDPTAMVVMAMPPPTAVTGEGPMIFEHACKLGLEGIVSKRIDLPCKAGPSKGWLKIKNKKHPALLRVAEFHERERSRRQSR